MCAAGCGLRPHNHNNHASHAPQQPLPPTAAAPDAAAMPASPPSSSSRKRPLRFDEERDGATGDASTIWSVSPSMAFWDSPKRPRLDAPMASHAHGGNTENQVNAAASSATNGIPSSEAASFASAPPLNSIMRLHPPKRPLDGDSPPDAAAAKRVRTEPLSLPLADIQPHLDAVMHQMHNVGETEFEATTSMQPQPPTATALVRFVPQSRPPVWDLHQQPDGAPTRHVTDTNPAIIPSSVDMASSSNLLGRLLDAMPHPVTTTARDMTAGITPSASELAVGGGQVVLWCPLRSDRIDNRRVHPLPPPSNQTNNAVTQPMSIQTDDCIDHRFQRVPIPIFQHGHAFLEEIDDSAMNDDTSPMQIE